MSIKKDGQLKRGKVGFSWHKSSAGVDQPLVIQNQTLHRTVKDITFITLSTDDAKELHKFLGDMLGIKSNENKSGSKKDK